MKKKIGFWIEDADSEGKEFVWKGYFLETDIQARNIQISTPRSLMKYLDKKIEIYFFSSKPSSLLVINFEQKMLAFESRKQIKFGFLCLLLSLGPGSDKNPCSEQGSIQGMHRTNNHCQANH